MIAEAIDKILSFKKEHIYEIDGVSYCGNTIHPVMKPRAKAFEIHSLSGIIDWLSSEDADGKKVMIWVENWKSVNVIGIADSQFYIHDWFVCSSLLEPKQFGFGQMMELEEFVIGLQCKFVDSIYKEKIIKHVANIRTEEVINSEDDGISQEVVVANRIGRIEKQKLNPIVELAPYRSFDEIKQPESKFLFRLKKGNGNLPLAALFEADGGQWKTEALRRIKNWFHSQDFIVKNKIKIIG